MTQIPKEWFSQAGIVLSNMCVAAIRMVSLNGPCSCVYYLTKKAIGFEKMNDFVFYIVCAFNVVLFAYFTRNPDLRQLRRLIANFGIYVRPTDAENETPQNEEIELQPLADQNEEV